MRNEPGDIVQDQEEGAAAREWKDKARTAGTAAWDATKATYQQIQDKSVACGRATDEAIRENTYMSLGIAFGIGILLGCLITDRNSEERGEY